MGLSMGGDGAWGVGVRYRWMKEVLERAERGRDCGRGGVVQMWKGEDGMDVAFSFEDDDEEEGEGEDEEMPNSCPSQIRESKLKNPKCAPPLLLTLTDEHAALAAPESNQLLHLQLGKRYYAERLILCGWSRVLCACSCLPSFFLPAFTLALTTFLQKEKMLTHFLF